MTIAESRVPPFIKMTAAVPLLHMQLKVPPNQGRPNQTEAFLDGKAFVWGNGGDRVLFPARMMCAGLRWRWVADLSVGGGDVWIVAGILRWRCLCLIRMCWRMGDGDDRCGAACCFVPNVQLLSVLHEAGVVRLGVAGVALGLALSAKYTGIFLVPMLVLAVVAEGLMAGTGACFGVGLGRWC